MKKKFLSALILSTFILTAPSNADDIFKSSGTIDLPSNQTLSDDIQLPPQTDDLIIDGHGFGIDGNGKQLYRTDSNKPENPTMDEKSITIQNVGSFVIQDDTSGEYGFLNLEGRKQSISITNAGLHNFLWAADDFVSSVSENSSVFYHNGDITILKSVIKDNSVTHNSLTDGRSGGAIRWNNDITYGDEWEIESETGKNGFSLKDSLLVNNSITSAKSDEDAEISGGALGLDGSGENNKSNTVKIENSYFIKNYIDVEGASQSPYGGALGGAIYASGINDFSVTNSYFGENYVKSNYSAEGGAIYIDDSEVYDNPYVIDKTVFYNNHTTSTNNTGGIAQGGAINAYYYTDIKNSLFVDNYSETKHIARGGALYLQNVDNDFEDGDEYWNEYTFNIENTTFEGNSAKVISEESSSRITYPVTVQGGAVYNDRNATTTIKNSTFTNNKSIAEGKDYTGTAQGGAIYNSKDGSLTVVDSTFSNNEAIGQTAAGGAIYNAENANLTIIAENSNVLFENNKSGTDDNNLSSDGISDAGGTINFNAKEDKSVFLNDKIISVNDEENKGIININKSSDGTSYKGNIVLNNDMKDYTGTVNLEGGTLVVGQNGTLFENAQSFNVNLPSNLNVANGKIGSYNLGNLKLNADLNTQIDADLQKGEIDKFEVKSVSGEGHLNVSHVNLLSDMVDGEDYKNITLTEDTALKDVITLSDNAKQALTPIWSYNVDYEDGEMHFVRGDKVEDLPQNPNQGGSSTPATSWKAFNPAVLSSVVAAQAGAVATMNNGFYYGMLNSENYMNYPKEQRLAYRLRNRYADNSSSQNSPFSPIYSRETLNGAWFRPYSTFENIPLKNGPKVQNISYGAYIGYDSEIVDTKHGWERSWTGYVSYNGASQKFSGVDSTLNGGSLGGTLSLYKGNFFNALTLSAGSLIGDSSNMYGKEDYTMLIAGAADRMGYNFEFFKGKFIFQPSLLLGYTFVNTFDYTNSANIRINSNPLSVMQISPGTKFIFNTKNGWQPYLGVNMIWNLINSTEVTANDVLLPEMSIKPYVQYGIGIQRVVNSDFMFFGQAMVQNGGRNGVSLNAGLRWAIGRKN